MLKESKLLKSQIKKLEEAEFDLEAWKAATSALLMRILGKEDPRIQQIEKLKIDYGSWALRDAEASYNPTESNKKQGKEILEVVIAELEAFGPNNANGSAAVAIIKDAMESELKAAQLKSIKSVLQSDDDKEARLRKLESKLKEIDEGTKSKALARILVNTDLGKYLD